MVAMCLFSHTPRAHRALNAARPALAWTVSAGYEQDSVLSMKLPMKHEWSLHLYNPEAPVTNILLTIQFDLNKWCDLRLFHPLKLR